MFTLNYAVNFSLGALLGFLALVFFNMMVLFVRVRWFNKPTELCQKRIGSSLSWCIFWTKWLVLSIIAFFVLYAISVN